MKFFTFCLPLVSLLFLSSVADLKAQNQTYQFKEIQEGVKFSSRWSDTKWHRKESPQALCLRILNTNTYAIEVSFAIGFYFEGMEKETMMPTTICLAPGASVLGRKNYLCWVSESLSNADLESNDFEWELLEVVVKQVESCP